MKRNIIFILTLYLFLASCSSNKEIFAPKELVVNPLVSVFSGKSQSVVRNSETVIEVKNSSETYFTVKKAITIFEKENKDIGQLVLGYSPLVELKYVNANITDKNGNDLDSPTARADCPKSIFNCN